MRRALLLLALVWVPFLAIFGFAHPTVTGALGDSHPHLVFHVLSSLLLGLALAQVVRLGPLAPGRGATALRGLLGATLALAVLGNLVELAAAVRRLADDGWVSRATPDLFAPGGGLHHLGASLTVPAHLASMLLALALAVVVAVRARQTRPLPRPDEAHRGVVRPG